MLGIFSCTGSRMKGEDGFEKGAEIAQLSGSLTLACLHCKAEEKCALHALMAFLKGTFSTNVPTHIPSITTRGGTMAHLKTKTKLSFD